nr:hypothetical protein GCM10020092_046210 [Actinoplanes digitatis]
MPTYDDPAFGELTDPRVRLLIDLLSRDVHGELIAVALSSAGLDPGDYPLDRARLTWTAAVPDAARLGRLGALIEVVSATRPTFTRELESRLALLLRPPPAGGYSEDDPYRCSFVGLRGARAVIDRAGLRDGLRDLAEDQYWVLVVHGHPRSGKSHTWLLVDHLRNVGKLVGVNRFARVTTHRWSGEVTGEAVAMSLASELGLPVTLSPSGELDDARVRKFLDHLVGVYPGDDGVTRWIILDGLDRPGVQEGARDLARGLIQLVEDGELPQTRLIVTGLDPLGLHVGYAVRTEEIPAIDGTLLRAFLTDVAARLGRDIGDAELDAWITEILGPVPAARDLSEVEAAVVRLVRSNWTREAGPVGETPGTAAAGADRLVRAAVLSVFDLDWLEPGLADASGADRLANFLADSCERVVDVRGVPRWRLRDDERLRVLRSVPREVLLAAVDAAPRRPDEPVQHVLERYLRGTLPPPASLAPAELTGVLQLERWLGPRPGLPARRDVESRLDWLNLLAPLRRLLARGFVGREDVLAALTAHVDAPHPRPPFVIEGVARQRQVGGARPPRRDRGGPRRPGLLRRLRPVLAGTGRRMVPAPGGGAADRHAAARGPAGPGAGDPAPPAGAAVRPADGIFRRRVPHHPAAGAGARHPAQRPRPDRRRAPPRAGDRHRRGARAPRPVAGRRVLHVPETARQGGARPARGGRGAGAAPVRLHRRAGVDAAGS